MKVCLLASGSKGNAIFIESGGCRLLIDAGLSAKEIERRLSLIGVCAASLSAIVLSHEHEDHGRGVGPLSRRFALPLYLQAPCHQALPRLGSIDDLRYFEAGETLRIGELAVETFSLTHDSRAHCGFVLVSGEGRVGVATDFGLATRLVVQRLSRCRVLVLESNHDEEMLRDGPYPWPLKQRVRSHHGHLSNRESAELLQSLLWPGLEAVFLAHLSEVNNLPRLARACALGVLDAQQLCRPLLVLGTQTEPTHCFAV